MAEYVVDQWMATEVCCDCGMQFAIPLDYQKRRKNDHEWFYCPAGHKQHYVGQTEEQKLRRQLDHERQQGQAIREQRDQLAKSYRKMRERIKNGVCPCCNRTFQNLMSHMRDKHPEFGNPSKAVRFMRDLYGLTQQALADEIGVEGSHISLFEREKPVTAWASSAIESWLDRQGSE